MISASTLAALSVHLPVEPFTSGAPNIVDIFGSALHVLGYVVAVLAVSDVKVTHRLVVISELPFPLLIGNDILRLHCAIIELGPPDVVQLGVDRCPVCVNQRVPVTPQHDVAAAVASVLLDSTLHLHAASKKPVYLPPKVLGDPTTVVEQLLCGLASTANAVLSEVGATTDDIRAISPIAAVSSVTPQQLSLPAFRRQACGSRRDARRLRRPRGRYRVPLRGVTPRSNAGRRRR